jgi:hypothetical protein
MFHKFVADFGGEILPEAPNVRTADYYFRESNVIAELKTLTEDVTEKMNQKLSPIVLTWIRKNGLLPGSIKGRQFIMDMKNMPTEIFDEWMRLMKTPIDHLVAQANRQIRDTKERFNLMPAMGLIIIANEANQYHNDPDSYRLLILSVLGKRATDGSRRFPNVDGAVYFSPLGGVQSRAEKMYYWANLIDKTGTPFAKFQRDLRQGWYEYIEKESGIKIRQHPQPETTP